MGRSSKPDTSAYDRQLAEQKAAAEAAEAEAAKLKAEQQAADQRRQDAMMADRAGRTSLIATSSMGDESTGRVKRKSLLGG